MLLSHLGPNEGLSKILTGAIR